MGQELLGQTDPHSEDNHGLWMTRRRFNHVAATIAANLLLNPFLSACGLRSDNTRSQSTPVVPRTPSPDQSSRIDLTFIPIREVEWREDQIKLLAKAMQQETDFPLIVSAGTLLQDNIEEEPSVSKVSPIFVEKKIKVLNVAEVSKNPGIQFSPYIGLDLEAFGSQGEIVLEKKDGSGEDIIETRQEVNITSIRLAFQQLPGKSDFWIKFMVAQEVNGIAAQNYAAEIAATSSYEIYQRPALDTHEILKVYSLFHAQFPDIGGIGATELGDILAHFIIIPDYARAKDLGRFGRAELGLLGFHESVFLYFQRQGVLVKDSQGKYQWSPNVKLLSAWVEAARRVSPIYREYIGR